MKCQDNNTVYVVKDCICQSKILNFRNACELLSEGCKECMGCVTELASVVIDLGMVDR
jgi:hypothetical protein